MIFDVLGGGFVVMDLWCNDDKFFVWVVRLGLFVLSFDYKKVLEYFYLFVLNECFDVYFIIY